MIVCRVCMEVVDVVYIPRIIAVPASSLACALNSAADREKHAKGISQVGAW